MHVTIRRGASKLVEGGTRQGFPMKFRKSRSFIWNFWKWLVVTLNLGREGNGYNLLQTPVPTDASPGKSPHPAPRQFGLASLWQTFYRIRLITPRITSQRTWTTTSNTCRSVIQTLMSKTTIPSRKTPNFKIHFFANLHHISVFVTGFLIYNRSNTDIIA